MSSGHACPLCRAQARDGLVCTGCVANTLYYKQQVCQQGEGVPFPLASCIHRLDSRLGRGMGRLIDRSDRGPTPAFIHPSHHPPLSTPQGIAYKKVALRDAHDQAQAVLAAQSPLREEERALTGLIRRQAELKEQLRQVGAFCAGVDRARPHY